VSVWKQGKSENAQGPWSALAPFLTGDLPEAVPAPAAPEPTPLTVRTAELERFREDRRRRRIVSAGPTYAVASVTSVAHAAAEKPAWESTGRGMSWGRVLHAVLEAVMRDETLDLAAFAANALAEEERPAAELPEVLRVVEAVRSSELWARARRAKRCLVEVPFALRVAPEEIGLPGGPSDSLLQGAIDLVFEEDDGWHLIDYKSDTAGDNLPELIAFYKPQVELYRRYWEQMTRRPTRAGLFFIASGEPVWLASPETHASM
jgi:ATP-dependent helicase/nuclease subunit A